MSKKSGLVDSVRSLPPDPAAALLKLDTDGRVALLRKENKQLRDRLRERDAGLEIVQAAFEQAYDVPLAIHIPNPPQAKNGKTTEEAIIHLTDVHFGKETSTYNSTVAAERLLMVCRAVEEIVNLRRTYAKIDRLTLLLGGDFIEGEGEIFPTQAHEIDQDLIDQMIKFGPERIAEVVLYFSRLFPTVSVIGVPGNHGRQGKRAAKRNNADSIFYEVVRLIVRSVNAQQAKRVKWSLPLDRERGDEWFANFKICDKWGGLLVHGDQIRGQLGFPWYGYGKKLGGWSSILPAFDFLFSGHFHTDASFDIFNRHVFSTGSTESDNSYAKENMAAAGSPKQRLCFFNKRYGLLSDSPLHLSNHRPMR